MTMRTRMVLAGATTALVPVFATHAMGATATAATAEQTQRACTAAPQGSASCFALVVSGAPSAAPDGGGGGATPYGPAQLQAAYDLPASGGSGQTIAIVDAYDDPTAAADLAVYRHTYGLPPCTVKNGCLSKLDEEGQTSPLPAADPGWGIEISLDIDMVSAACPLCHIVLLEASSNSFNDLGATENAAAALHPAVISNSYGNAEFNGMQQLAPEYSHPGITIVVASGDTGFGPANFPAVLKDVMAVGGTSLTQGSAGHRGWSEVAWFAGSSGCSAYIAKPSWQPGTHCSMRTVADVSADADPYPGLAVYDTSIPPGFDGLSPGWLEVGGTSASAPFIAGVIGLAGNGGSIPYSYPYTHSADFFDIRSGSNGYCGGDYLCTARKGYDAPTGVGSPHGIGGL